MKLAVQSAVCFWWVGKLNSITYLQVLQCKRIQDCAPTNINMGHIKLILLSSSFVIFLKMSCRGDMVHL